MSIIYNSSLYFIYLAVSHEKNSIIDVLFNIEHQTKTKTQYIFMYADIFLLPNFHILESRVFEDDSGVLNFQVRHLLNVNKLEEQHASDKNRSRVLRI